MLRASLMMLLLVGCAHRAKPPVQPPATSTTSTAAPSAASTLNPSALEKRISELLSESDSDRDQQDRLRALRELLYAVRGQEAAPLVYAYIQTALDIEARALPQPLESDPTPPKIEAEPLGAPGVLQPPKRDEAPLDGPDTPLSPASGPDGTPTGTGTPPTFSAPADPQRVQAAKSALAQKEFLQAVTLLDGQPGAEAESLRKQAVDGWARAQREEAGQRFLEARKLPAGPEKIRALQDARDQLAAINTRFPTNAYADKIRENIAQVDIELKKLETP